MAVAEVVTLRDHSLRDVPRMLRMCADAIEAGEHGDAKMIAAVLVRDDLSMATFGWGDCGVLETAGALIRGASAL